MLCQWSSTITTNHTSSQLSVVNHMLDCESSRRVSSVDVAACVSCQ